MSILNTRLHTGTNAATATTANTGYDSDTGAGTAPTFTTGTAPPNATSCITWTGGGSAARQFIANDDAQCSVILVRINATPTNPITFLRKRDSGTTALAQCRITTGRLMDLRDGSATVSTSSFALVNNTWYQIVFNVASAAGTIQIWSADGQTLHETVSGTVGSGAVGDTTCGQFNGSASAVFLGQHILADTMVGPEIRPLKPEKNSMAGQSSIARAVGRSYQWREAVSGLFVPVRALGPA